MTLKTGASIAVLAIALGITPATAQTNTGQKPAATTEVPKTPVSGQIMTQDSNSLLAKDFRSTAYVNERLAGSL